MAEESTQTITICWGARVRRANRVGLVVELPTDRAVANSRQKPWAEVIPEGSSTGRAEQWPIAETALLPRSEQLPLLGGAFQPPKGYPFVTRRS